MADDGAYSDEEFGSEHEESGYDEFEEVTEAETGPVGDNEAVADAENYDGEFEEEEEAAVETATTAADEYDEGFDEDETAAEAINEQADKGPSSGEKLARSEEQHDQSESTNEGENEEEASPPVASVDKIDVAKRRSSVPTAIPTDMSLPKQRILRAGSMPIVLPARPPDKWMDAAPQELSPEKADLSPKNHLPVLEEVQPASSADDETTEDESANAVEEVIKAAPRLRIRAQSSSDFQSDKTVVPRRRAQSLLFILPSVQEVQATEETNAEDDQTQESENSYSGDDENHVAEENQTGEDGANTAHCKSNADSYSEDEDGFGGDNDNGFQSEDGKETDAQPPNDENPTNTVLPHEGSSHVASKTDDTNPRAESILDNASIPNAREVTDTREIEPTEQQEEDDVYPEEMEDEFLSESTTPHVESDEKSDVVDGKEDIDAGRQETDNLLQEALSLLQRQQNNQPYGKSIAVANSLPQTATEYVSTENASDSPIANAEKDKSASLYDDDDEEFVDDDADDDAASNRGGIDQYEFEEEDDGEPQEATVPPQKDSESVADTAVLVSVAEPAEPLQLSEDTSNSNQAKEEEKREPLAEKQSEAAAQAHSNQQPETSNTPAEQDSVLADEQNDIVEDKTTPTNSVAPLQSVDLAKENITVEPDQAPKPAPPPEAQPPARPCRPNRPVKKAVPTEQPNPLKLSRPTSNRPVSSSTGDQQKAVHRPAQKHPREPTPADPDLPTEGNSADISNPPPRSPSPGKPISPQKKSSPRAPSRTPYQYLPIEYPKLPKKEPVPKQRVSARHLHDGEHAPTRRPLQPVRTPANLRFDLPKMDKTKRNWLFVNMFRHGDDLTKYEAFMPSTLAARPPGNNSMPRDTKKRPLSARQVYGDSQKASGFGRKLVDQPDESMRDRERNWVSTTPHDSKLPAYDSILDKFCTTVTSPLVQRQIYQTRQRDLSPQLAFVLEKRVEKQCRKGFYDSFGGVSSSYKTEVVSTSPGDDPRQRQMSPPRPQASSGQLDF